MKPLSPENTILAIDASTARVGVALWHKGQCHAKECWPSIRGNPGQLVQTIETMRNRCHLAWHQLDAVLVGCGPGQFAGLRVSVTAAMALQLPNKGPVLGIASAYAMLDATRLAHPDAPAIIICGDARRNHIWLYQWPQKSTETYPRLHCISHEQARNLTTPEGTIAASPDFQRLQKRLPLPATTHWIQEDIAPDPEHMIRVALANPTLLGPPDIQYVHPPVST